MFSVHHLVSFLLHHPLETHAVQIHAMRFALSVQISLLLKSFQAARFSALGDELDLWSDISRGEVRREILNFKRMPCSLGPSTYLIDAC